MKYLILGVDGMLGHVLFSEAKKIGHVLGTSRKSSTKSDIKGNVSVEDLGLIENIIREFQPDVVVNCIGVIKQLKEAYDPLLSIKINSLFPHELALIATKYNSKVIHFSTDCVFDGSNGNYSDDSKSDANDLYGRTKYLGEISYPNSFTLRTSIIGHELTSYHSLVDWFLSQKGECKGYTKAIYTGFPTIVLSDLIFRKIIPGMMQKDLHGVYNVSSDKISKYDLLQLIAKIYSKPICIIPDNTFSLDRSLNSSKFRTISGFQPESWESMIFQMREHFVSSSFYANKKEYKF